jgi:hypothetical protein
METFMPYINVGTENSGSIDIYYEDHGSGRPVVQNGALAGVVSRDAIVHYLEVRRSLGVETPKSDAQNRLRHAA